MTEQKKPFMEDQDFDALLTRSLPDLPPEDIVNRTIPGKEALGRILVGYLLYTFVIHFIGLDILLPTAGQILVLLGFRALQRENRWFRACYILEILHAVSLFGKMILDATIYEFPPTSETAILAVVVLQTAFTTTSLFCFWRGLRAVQKACGLRQRANAVLALLAWHFLQGILAVLILRGNLSINGGEFFAGKLSINGWGFLALFVSFAVILWLISRLAKALDATGYVLSPAPVRISDYGLTLILIAILVIGCACGYLFFNSYSMDWHPADTTESATTNDTKTQLAALGFPEDILDDIAPEDLAQCSGAEQVVVATRTLNSDQSQIENGQHDLLLTNIMVLVPGETPRVVFFHHFYWLTNPEFTGTEALKLHPVYEESADEPASWHMDNAVSGRVLYDENDKSFSAAYHAIETCTVVNRTFSFIPPQDLVCAAFSFPDEGTHHRGYITYAVTSIVEGQIFRSELFYVHQKHRFQYPVETAASAASTGGVSPFVSMQADVSLYELTNEGITLRG